MQERHTLGMTFFLPFFLPDLNTPMAAGRPRCLHGSNAAPSAQVRSGTFRSIKAAGYASCPVLRTSMLPVFHVLRRVGHQKQSSSS